VGRAVLPEELEVFLQEIGPDLSFAKTASGSLGDDPCPPWERPNTPGDWWLSVQRGPVSIPPAIGPALSSRRAGRRVVVVVSRAGLAQAACRA
jgi:hypothetical protein